MIHLPKAQQAISSHQFEEILVKELESLPLACLPLLKAVRLGSYVLDLPRKVIVFSVEPVAPIISPKANVKHVQVSVGVYFYSMLAGCSCADDPSPVEAQQEYCQLRLEMDLASAATQVSLVD